MSPTGQATGCQPDWVRQDIQILNDDSGLENCRLHCLGEYQTTSYKIIKETVLETRCYCDLNKC